MSDVPESTVEIPERVTSSTMSNLTKRNYPDGGYGKTLIDFALAFIKKLFLQVGPSSFVLFYCTSLPTAFPTPLD